MGGNMDVMFDNLPSRHAAHQGRQAEGAGGDQRPAFAALPELPTVAEAGGPRCKGYEASSWFGLLAPAGTPADIVNRVQQETAKALATPA
jgi:tripartite-type tricarboxylate transporter receptor subunit TctC